MRGRTWSRTHPDGGSRRTSRSLGRDRSAQPRHRPPPVWGSPSARQCRSPDATHRHRLPRFDHASRRREGAVPGNGLTRLVFSHVRRAGRYGVRGRQVFRGSNPAREGHPHPAYREFVRPAFPFQPAVRPAASPPRSRSTSRSASRLTSSFSAVMRLISRLKKGTRAAARATGPYETAARSPRKSTTRAVRLSVRSSHTGTRYDRDSTCPSRCKTMVTAGRRRFIPRSVPRARSRAGGRGRRWSRSLIVIRPDFFPRVLTNTSVLRRSLNASSTRRTSGSGGPRPPRSAHGCAAVASERLDLPNGQATIHTEFGSPADRGVVRELQECPGVTTREPPGVNHLLHVFRKFQ